MALINCKECNTEISTKAKTCPKCGAEVTKSVGLLGFAVVLFFGWLIFSTISTYNEHTDSAEASSQKIPKTAAELREEKIKRAFSAWDGSHIYLERWIKKNLKDPDSYDHMETRYGDKGDHILVSTKYRARNGFGGMTIGQAVAKTRLDGTIIEIIAQE